MGIELPATTKDITVEWLNEVLHENGFIGENDIVSIKREEIGTGEGLTSDMARIHLVYNNETSINVDSVIAKLPSTYKPIRDVCIHTGMYEREIRFYKEIAPLSPIRTPQCYFGNIDVNNERYVLLMEDCSKYSPPDPELKGISYEQAKAIVKTIADFHARWWDDESLSSYSWLPPSYKTIPGAFFSYYKQTWEKCSTIDIFKQSLSEESFDLSKQLSEKFHLIKNRLPQDKITIMHGDFKADNVFFDYSNNENPVIVFDWSMPSLWRGVADLCRLLGLSMETQLRRNHEKELIELYHSRLLERGISDYTFEECWDDYLTGYLRFSIIPLMNFTTTDLSHPRSRAFATEGIKRYFSAIVDNDAVGLLG